MTALKGRSLCRRVVSAVLWTLVLLVLTNVFWSVWFARRYAAIYLTQLNVNLVGYPTEWPLVLDADENHVTWFYPSESINAKYHWLSRYDISTKNLAPHERPAISSLVHSMRFTDPPRWVNRRWTIVADELAPGEHRVETLVGVGWPTRMLWCRWIETDIGTVIDPRTAIPVDSSPTNRIGPARVLPFRPIWSGQAFYAAIWLGVVLIAPFGWWRIRAMRGRCVWCGYDLHGNVTGVCPECGSEVS